jgi:transcriptional regulator GlxA family with amidase domain
LVEAYINAHISQKITNNELADVCDVSPKHFIKIFKKQYRMTPQDYIMRQRIKKAQFALLHTNLSVDSIAESMGFCNTSHFIRRFTEMYGVSPAKYRRSMVLGEKE